MRFVHTLVKVRMEGGVAAWPQVELRWKFRTSSSRVVALPGIPECNPESSGASRAQNGPPGIMVLLEKPFWGSLHFPKDRDSRDAVTAEPTSGWSIETPKRRWLRSPGWSCPISLYPNAAAGSPARPRCRPGSPNAPGTPELAELSTRPSLEVTTGWVSDWVGLCSVETHGVDT